jgi:hypothetical protein
LKDADFIQECASENYALKTKLMQQLVNMQNLMQLFHQVHQDYYQLEFIQNVKIQKEQLLDIHLIQFIYCLQLKLFLVKKLQKNI